VFKNILSIFLTFKGFIYYCFIRRTPNIFYQSYVRAYCFTNGWISKILSKIISLKIKKKIKNIDTTSEYFKESLDYSKIQNLLETDGYYFFDSKLNQNFQEKVMEFTENNECYFFDDNGKEKFGIYRSIENKKNLSSKFSYNESKIFNVEVINKLVFDPCIIQICENYFESKACLSNIDMWWTPVREKASIKNEIANKSAQFFHFDLDRIKWLKFFIYLTDTTLDDGPHEYVKGTNKVSGKYKKLLNKGYKRIKEENIYNYYNSSSIKKLLGKKGTIFVGDTSCFHRGFPPIKNDRLLLVLEYSNSMFGGNYNKIKLNKNFNFDTRLNIKSKIIL
jgi:hypothetical protein